jgi:nucleoprotein TPR
LQKLKSSSTTSSSELEKLRSRISTLEAGNRNTIILLDSKSAAHDRLAEELSVQQQKIIALRKETSELEEKLQRAEHVAMTSKFREQNLQQEIDLLKKSGDWHEDELKRRSAEHTRFRKEKAVQIAELQRTCDDATQSAETLRKTEAILRNRLDEGMRKLEDTLAKSQALEQESSTLQESFRAELDNAHRLAELQKQSAATSRARLRDVQAQLDRSRDEAADEVGRLQAEMEKEIREKLGLEQKVSDLETNIEALESALAESQRASRPGTPRGSINGLGPRTPARGASPGLFSSPASSRLKLNVTQLYSENARIKSELDGERRKNDKLRQTMDDMIHDLEKQQPGIEELRMDHERLQADIEQTSTMLEETTKARDESRREARAFQGRIAGLNMESELLKQELRDLSIQIRFLLLEAKAREDGMENISPADQALLEQAISGEINLEEFADMSVTQKQISQRLTVYRDIAELQERNVHLLYLTRKLGEQMEGEEALARSNQHEQDQKELEDLRSKVEHQQEELKSASILSESYIRERDMFRRMLSHRGQLPADADLSSMFGQSTGIAPFDASRSVGPRDPDAPDFNLLIKELQSQYDAYRRESTTDQATLKDQLNQLSRDKSGLQAEIAKTSSQLMLAHERYELLQSNFMSLRAENSELQKRSSMLSEVAAKQDVRTQQVAEDLMDARSLTDGLRNENANLKAERELWKKIESRLGEDNRELMDERGRLNKMISDLQSLQNERELTDSETRRRLQARTDDLQSELQTTKRKLDSEIEECKKANQRREYDQEQSHARVEDLLKALGNTREELVAAKTQRDQLQTRVDELKIDLRNAEEKTLVLQPRLTSGNLEDQENRLTAEQELAIQVSDLKRDLEWAKNELQQANEHVEQYKSIAQAAEEELQNLTETNDQFREEMDRIVAEKDSRIQDLEKRVEEISSELASTHSELAELRAQQDEYNARFAAQRQILESEISRLRDEAERLSETSRMHQADLKAQAEIAQRSQQAYEDELVKHADAAKALQTVRQEFGQLKTQVAGFKAEAEAAKANLHDNEANWAEMKGRYENEIIDLKTRRDDISDQNRRLHQQLESVSAQIADLKQARPTEGVQGEAGTLDSGSNADEIMKWLRNEKEIVEVQLELSNQEAKRYKQKLERTEAQLDETLEKLNQERQSQMDRDQATMNHGKLLESINQLNLFRESNASLRNEARQAQTQLAERTTEAETLSAQLEPLRARIGEIENAVETKDGEIKLLQEDRDRWQKRNQDILQRYDRVDPAELEGLKNQVETLTQERNALLSERESLQQQVDGIPELTKSFEERRQKLIDNAKTKAREQSVIIRDKTSQLEQALQDISRLTEEVESTKVELESLKAEHAAQAAQGLQTVDQPAADGNDAEMTDATAHEADLPHQEQTEEAQLRLQELETQLEAALIQGEEAQQQLQAAQSDLQEEQSRYSSLDQEAQRLREQIVVLEEKVVSY